MRDGQSHRAQTSAVLDHSRTLPQGDGGAGPALAGGAVGGCALPFAKFTMLLVAAIILTTYSQEDRVAVVIKLQDRHALGEAWACEKAMNDATGIYVCSHNLVAIVDPKGSSIVGTGEGDINRAELPVVVYKAMRSRAIAVKSHNCAAVIDPTGGSIAGAGEGDINRAELPVVVYKAMRSRAIGVKSHNLAPVVDPKGGSLAGAGEGDINRTEPPLVIDKAMIPGTGVVDPNDLAFVVDLERQSRIGARERSNNGTECPPVIKKTML